MRLFIVASLLVSACGSGEKDSRILELEGQVQLLNKEKSNLANENANLQNEKATSLQGLQWCNEQIKTEQNKIKVLMEPIEKRHDKCEVECDQKYAKCLEHTDYFICDAKEEGCTIRCNIIRNLESHNLPNRPHCQIWE